MRLNVFKTCLKLSGARCRASGLAASALVFSACGPTTVSFTPLSSLEKHATNAAWTTATPLDAAPHTSSILPADDQYWTDLTVSSTFVAAQLKSNGRIAVLGAALQFPQEGLRAVGRVYRPGGSGVSGWDEGLTTLGGGAGATTDFAFALSSASDVLAAFSAGVVPGTALGAATQVSSGTAAWSPLTGWRDFAPKIVGPTVGDEEDFAPVSRVLTSVGAGFTMDLAWTPLGDAFLALRNALEGGDVARDPNRQPVSILRYGQATGWDPIASLITLPGAVSQLQLVEDGVGATLIYKGDKIFRAQQVAAGTDFFCAQGESGEWRCWGENLGGQLGVGDTAARLTGAAFGAGGDGLPALNLGTFPATQVALSDAHGCALSTYGAVRCWGSGADGRLGQGTEDDIGTGLGNTPTLGAVGAIDFGTDTSTGQSWRATQLGVGDQFSCALLNSGAARCWGHNLDGRLGQATASDWGDTNSTLVKNIPAIDFGSVGGVAYRVLSIAIGTDYGCAILGETVGSTVVRRVKCWGNNDASGKLGYDTAVPASIDNQAGLATDLADRAPIAFPTPVPTSTSLPLQPNQLFAGASHTCGLFRDGGLRCWGLNDRGQLGYAVTDVAKIGSTVAGLNRGMDYLLAPLSFGLDAQGNAIHANSVALGAQHTCALLNTGQVTCWGDNTWGQLGGVTATAFTENGLADTDLFSGGTRLTLDFGFNRLARQISCRGNGCCATLEDDSLACWGDNTAASGRGSLGTLSSAAMVTNPEPALVSCGSTPGGCALQAAWSEDADFGNPIAIHAEAANGAYAPAIQQFAAAADQRGNVVVAFIQNRQAAMSCETGATRCAANIYVSARGVQGQWWGPIALKDETSTTTTLWQDSFDQAHRGVTQGGKDFAKPAVVHLGDSKFMIAYPVIDNTAIDAPVSRVVVRTFTPGVGLDPQVTSLDETRLDYDPTDLLFSPSQFRAVNELRLATDGEGNALLLLQRVTDGSNLVDPASREYGYRVYRYTKSVGWDAGTDVAAKIPGCPVQDDFCRDPQMSAALFTNGQAVLVLPGPSEAYTAADRFYRLYTVEYR